MAQSMKFYKQQRGDSIWWVDTSESHGLWLFSFDKKQVYNMFTDYPHKLTPEQKAIFDKENPYWADFFKDREIPAEVYTGKAKSYGGDKYHNSKNYQR